MKIRGVLILFLTSIFFLGNILAQSPKSKVIIDADTGNEVDDLFAISRALIASEFKVVGLNSTQWQNSHWAVENTLENSHRLNVRILSYLNLGDIPHPRGSHYRLYDWGQDIAQHSAAAYYIIKEAHKASPTNKLTIIALGALTNVASALLIDPTIAPNIKLYCLGTSYNFEKAIWQKTDFNCLMDPHAINVVLDNADLELHITPVNIAVEMKMFRETLKANFKGQDDLRGFLYDRWMTHMDDGYNERVIWDLVPFYFLLNPRLIQEVQIQTPPENTVRKIFVTKTFDAEKISEDFFNAFIDYFYKKQKQ
jgi:inosine-uridine nucleoside N-ribohydrolase